MKKVACIYRLLFNVINSNIHSYNVNNKLLILI